MEKAYNYLYKITNQINGKYYYGIHSTNNLNDGYFGSGTYLNNAILKHGKENFKMEILEFRDTRIEISNLEKEIVTLDIIKDPSTYNIRLGGDDGKSIGTATKMDPITGKYKRVIIGSEDYIKGKGPNTGKVIVKDINGDTYKFITQEEYHANPHKYMTVSKGLVNVYDKINKITCWVSCEEFHTNRNRYKTSAEGMVTVIINGKGCLISKEEYDTGNYITAWNGRKHLEETKEKISNKHKEFGYLKGEKNSQWGTCWVNNGIEDKKIIKDELDTYLENGWNIGKCKEDLIIKYDIKLDEFKNEINEYTNKELGIKYGCSLSTIKKIIHKLNLKRNPVGPLKDLTLNKFIESYKKHNGIISQMCKDFGVSHNSLRVWAIKNKVPYKNKEELLNIIML